jgi:hypothetical protein
MSEHDPFANDDLASWVSDVVEDSWDDGEPGPDPDPDHELDADAVVDDDLRLDRDRDDAGLGGIELEDLDGEDGTSEERSDADVATSDDTDHDDAGIPSITLADPDADERSTGVRALDVTAVLGLAADLQDAEPDPGAVEAALERLDLGEGYLGIAGRGAALVLQELGVDAHVAHGTVEQLADRLDAGGRVSVSGPDGTRIPVVGVDFGQGELVVADEDGQRRIDLGPFVEAWSSVSFEMVVAGDEVVLPFAAEDGGI